MELTWMVPVALILAIGSYLAVVRVIKHREKMAAPAPQIDTALTLRVEAVEASLQRLGASRAQS